MSEVAGRQVKVWSLRFRKPNKRSSERGRDVTLEAKTARNHHAVVLLRVIERTDQRARSGGQAAHVHRSSRHRCRTICHAAHEAGARILFTLRTRKAAQRGLHRRPVLMLCTRQIESRLQARNGPLGDDGPPLCRRVALVGINREGLSLSRHRLNRSRRERDGAHERCLPHADLIFVIG